MTEQARAIDWEHVARASAHPLRIAVLECLAAEQRPLSPRELAARVGQPLGNVAYRLPARFRLQAREASLLAGAATGHPQRRYDGWSGRAIRRPWSPASAPTPRTRSARSTSSSTRPPTGGRSRSPSSTNTRECLGRLVDRSITGDDVIDELDRIASERGYPAVLRCDNGPEPACAAMDDWARERVGLHFIPPGEPRATAMSSRSTPASETNVSTSASSGPWPKPAS